MGDRGNIVVLQEAYTSDKTQQNLPPNQIWLYSHWGGSDLPDSLQRALRAAPGRWDDDSYLARIILMRMIPEKCHTEETGWGISAQITDNEHDILVCDVANKRVFVIKESELESGRVPFGYEPKDESSVWSFEQFKDLKKLPKI